MTLLMCKFVDSEMDDEIMRENAVLFTPTNNEDKPNLVGDDGKESTVKVSEEVSTTGPTSASPYKEGDATNENGENFDKRTQCTEMELDKKRKTLDKTPLENEKIVSSSEKKLKTFSTEQIPQLMDESDKNATDTKQDNIPTLHNEVEKQEANAGLKVINKVIETETKDDQIAQISTETEDVNSVETKEENDSCRNGSENVSSVETKEDKDSCRNEFENVSSVETKDDDISSICETKNTTETKEIPPLSNGVEEGASFSSEQNTALDSAMEPRLLDQEEMDEAKSTKEDGEIEITDAENLITKDGIVSEASNLQNLPNDKKAESNEDSQQEDKMEDIVNEEFSADSSQNTNEVEDMDDSELLTDPAILEAIKLSEITASKELDRAIAESEEMEDEEEEEEPEEPWTPEDYGIYSRVKEFGSMKLPKKALMKAFKKELAAIKFGPASESSQPGESEPSKETNKEETVSSQINFLLNIGLTPSAPTDQTKDKEAARLRRLDKMSKMSAKSKLRMGRRSIKRIEDRFRANLIKTVQQNTEVSTLCKEMLILDLNPTKYLWGSALLRKRELSKKLKEWFKEAKKSEAKELENPSSISAQDNPSLPSKLLRFTSCDTAPAPSLVLQIKIGKAGLDLKWQSTTDQQDFSLLATRHYELQCCHAATPWEQPTEWKTIGNIKAMPLPMACTIRKFEAGHIYSFRIRAVKSKKDRSEFSEHVSITL